MGCAKGTVESKELARDWRGMEGCFVRWCMYIVRRIHMTKKKLSASSRSGKQIHVSAESIWNKPLNDRQKTALDGIAKRQKRADVSQIDYSDIPALTDEQLSQL